MKMWFHMTINLMVCGYNLYIPIQTEFDRVQSRWEFHERNQDYLMAYKRVFLLNFNVFQGISEYEFWS